MKRIVLSILVLAFAAASLFAADGPSPKLKELATFDGHWTCSGTAFPFLGMPEHKTTATVDGTWELDRFWFSLHYKEARTAANATPVEVRYLWGWDNEVKKFASIAADNGGGHFSQTSPGWNNNTITFEGDMHIAGKTMKFHDVFTRVSASKIMHRGEAVIDGKWTKLDEETCSR